MLVVLSRICSACWKCNGSSPLCPYLFILDYCHVHSQKTHPHLAYIIALRSLLAAAAATAEGRTVSSPFHR
jgi:hypothetical protein